jgi:prophage regulatory protein
MTKKPSRSRILMMPYQDDENSDPKGYSRPATVLTGLPRTIRRYELRLIVPLADSTIYEMEKRGEFPRRFNLTPRCVVWDLEEVEAWLEQRRQIYVAGRAKIAPSPDVRQRKTRPVRAVVA